MGWMLQCVSGTIKVFVEQVSVRVSVAVSWKRSFAHSFVCSFVRSLIRWFAHLFVRPYLTEAISPTGGA